MSNNAAWPQPFDLEAILPLPKTAGERTVESLTSLSPDTIKRRYPEYVVKLSPRREGMKTKHALAISNGTLKR